MHISVILKYMKKLKKPLLISYLILLHLFAFAGASFIGVFFAIKYKITNVSGETDALSASFNTNFEDLRDSESTPAVVSAEAASAKAESSNDVGAIDDKISQLTQEKKKKMNFLCNLQILSAMAPKNMQKILAFQNRYKSEYLTNQMIFAVKTHFEDVHQFDQNILSCEKEFDAEKNSEDAVTARIAKLSAEDIFVWPETKQWSDVKLSVKKDAEKIRLASEKAGIEPRLLVSSLIVEQLRLYFSQRELYQKFFEPLKILANSTKISLGVMSIKEETAIQIENNLKNPASLYYLGKDLETALDYPAGVNIPAERYKRLTSNDHYYNYLYGALYLRQFIEQWKKSGHEIRRRPEILTTLFNVGFAQSKPNPNPKVGGSTVTIGDTQYTFGRLGYEFYYSGELEELFPYTIL